MFPSPQTQTQPGFSTARATNTGTQRLGIQDPSGTYISECNANSFSSGNLIPRLRMFLNDKPQTLHSLTMPANLSNGLTAINNSPGVSTWDRTTDAEGV